MKCGAMNGVMCYQIGLPTRLPGFIDQMNTGPVSVIHAPSPDFGPVAPCLAVHMQRGRGARSWLVCIGGTHSVLKAGRPQYKNRLSGPGELDCLFLGV